MILHQNELSRLYWISGYLLAGSRLQYVFELIYAANSVVHMLSGKAIAPVVQENFAPLNTILLSVIAMYIPNFVL